MTEHPDIRRALELAAQCPKEKDIPRELKEAVRYIIGNGWARIEPCLAVLPPSQGELFDDRPVILPVPGESRLNRLILKERGEAELGRLRLGEQPAKPKAKRGRPSTAEQRAKIAEKYYAGLEAGEWKTQAEYLRKNHKRRWDKNAKAAKSWLSTLLRWHAGRQKLNKYGGD